MIIGQESDVISNKKLGFSLAEDFFFFWDHVNLDRKSVPILVDTFFFVGDHQYLATKIYSIRSNTDQSLGQDRLMLFPASKIPPTLQIPGYAPEWRPVAHLF